MMNEGEQLGALLLSIGLCSCAYYCRKCQWASDYHGTPDGYSSCDKFVPGWCDHAKKLIEAGVTIKADLSADRLAALLRQADASISDAEHRGEWFDMLAARLIASGVTLAQSRENL